MPASPASSTSGRAPLTASRPAASSTSSSRARPTSAWRSSAAASGAGHAVTRIPSAPGGARLRRRRLAAQHAVVHGHRGLAGRGAELVAQQDPQLLERAQRLGRVARPPRGPPSAAGARTRGTARRRSPRARPARRRRARGRPGAGTPRRAPRAPRRRIVSSSRRSSSTHGPSQSGRKVCRSTPSTSRARAAASAQSWASIAASARAAAVAASSRSTSIVPAGHEAQLGAAGERALAERPAQLGEQRAERGVGGGGRPLGPQQVDQLGPAAVAIAVEDQVGEQQATLAARHGRARARPSCSTPIGPQSRMVQPFS